MGAMQNNPSKAGKAKGRRGSVRNGDRLQAFSQGAPASGGDWGSCDPKWLQAVVVAITKMGGAVTLGLSRDKGSHSLTLLLDDNRRTLWFNGGADLDEELHNVVDTLESMA